MLEEAIDKVEDQIGIDNLYDTVNTPLVGFLNNAIRAKELFKKDRDYVVMNGEVIIVDEHTGRILPGRRYNEGLHQSIEAKEGVEVKAENQTLATVTLQNFFRLYKKLSGMTGTAMTEAAEFNQIYNLGVVPIPTNRDDGAPRQRRPRLPHRATRSTTPSSRTSSSAMRTASRSSSAPRASRSPRPCRGCSSRTASRTRSSTPSTTSARPPSSRRPAAAAPSPSPRTWPAEAPTSSSAATPSSWRRPRCRSRACRPIEDPEAYEAAWPDELEKSKAAVTTEHEEVTDLGGLYVLATERHESRRIDNQLRGRSGRQGDPGESQFYLSLEDDLMRLFKSDMVDAFLRRFNVPDDVPIEAKMVTNAIRSAQSQVEAQNFEIRKDVLKYDDVLNRQRLVIYDERRRVLEGEDIQDQVRTFITDTVDRLRAGGHLRGLPRVVGPRPAVDRAQAALPGRRHGRGARGRAPAAAAPA